MALNFDQFLEAKENPGIKAFIFLLDDEYAYLENTTHWLNHVAFNCHVVRLSESEFNMLDIGKHPKVIFFKNGRESQQFDGLPTLEQMQTAFRSIR